MRQMNFDTKLEEVSRKPSVDITQRDAREMQSSEVGPFQWFIIPELYYCLDASSASDLSDASSYSFDY